MIICISSFQPDSSPFLFLFSANFLFSSNKHHLLLQQISSSSSNLRIKVQFRGPFKKQCVLVNIDVLKSLSISVCTAGSFSGSPQNHFSVPLTKHGCKKFFSEPNGFPFFGQLNSSQQFEVHQRCCRGF